MKKALLPLIILSACVFAAAQNQNIAPELIPAKIIFSGLKYEPLTVDDYKSISAAPGGPQFLYALGYRFVRANVFDENYRLPKSDFIFIDHYESAFQKTCAAINATYDDKDPEYRGIFFTANCTFDDKTFTLPGGSKKVVRFYAYGPSKVYNAQGEVLNYYLNYDHEDSQKRVIIKLYLNDKTK